MKYLIPSLLLLFQVPAHASPANLMARCESTDSNKNRVVVTFLDVFQLTDLVWVDISRFSQSVGGLEELVQQDVYVGTGALMHQESSGPRRIDKISNFIQLNHAPADGVIKPDTLLKSGLLVTWMNNGAHRIWEPDGSNTPLRCKFAYPDLP